MITDKVGGLVTMFYRERLDSSKMAFINWVQNCKQVSRFCLDQSHARNGREIWKQLKQTCRTKQRKEKQLKHKVSGYKSQSKWWSITGCCLLLRTLYLTVLLQVSIVNLWANLSFFFKIISTLYFYSPVSCCLVINSHSTISQSITKSRSSDWT